VIRRALILCAVASMPLPALAAANGGLYGTITTDRGETLTGNIRWDKNENFWDDLLDATKKDKVKLEGQANEGLDLKVLGIRVRKGENKRDVWARSQFSIPMGHIHTIEPRRHGEVTLKLKNGETVRIKEGADIGENMRGIVVSDDDGETKLDWEDVEEITFEAAPRHANVDDQRLYGMVETKVGDFTGFVVWDKDESMLDDVLDGEENDRDREIRFGNIASIERLDNWGSLVVLRSGKEMELEGTNDVNDDNRGLEITIPDLGKVVVPWKAFVRVTFEEPPASLGYDAFDGGGPIRGTVIDVDGNRISGDIVWDMDESRTWESLDGKIKNVDVRILFENLDRVEFASRAKSRVVLKDGLELTLSGSNDVNDENKGILVTEEDGTQTQFEWAEVDAVEFQ